VGWNEVFTATVGATTWVTTGCAAGWSWTCTVLSGRNEPQASAGRANKIKINAITRDFTIFHSIL
jgi:hypothetical protein